MRPLRVLRTGPEWDYLLTDPSQQTYFETNFDRIVSYDPYPFEWGIIDWDIPFWFYFNTQDGPDGFDLLDTDSAPLYVPWPSQEGPVYPRTTKDIFDPDYRSGWIDQAQDLVTRGAKGFWIDDVNIHVGGSAVRSGGGVPLRDMSAWGSTMALFMEEVRAALDPEIEILHNSVWFSNGPQRWVDPQPPEKLYETSFENDADMEFNNMSSGVISVNAVEHHNGSKSRKCVTPGDYPEEGVTSFPHRVTGVPGDQFTQGIWVKGTVGKTMGLQGAEGDALGDNPGWPRGYTEFVMTGSWQYVTVSSIMSEDCETFWVMLIGEDLIPGEFYIDEYVIVRGAPVPAFGDPVVYTPNPVRAQIAAADYVNIEHGFDDPGLNEGESQPIAIDYRQWSVRSMLDYIDNVHGLGTKFIVETWDDSAEKPSEEGKLYNLAVWWLIAEDGDGIGFRGPWGPESELGTWPYPWSPGMWDLGQRLSFFDEGGNTPESPPGVGGAMQSVHKSGMANVTPIEMDSASVVLFPAPFRPTEEESVSVGLNEEFDDIWGRLR